MTSRYLELGVDAHKRGVELFEELIENVAPYAFATVIREPGSNEGIILHVDGAGSKPIVAYLYHMENGETRWYRGLAQDVVAMNIDDIMAVGAEPVAFADYIALNTLRLPKRDVISELCQGFKEVFDLLSRAEDEVNFKLRPIFAGGETADLPDQIRTLDVVGFILGKVKLERAIKGDKIPEGTLIVGLRSGGKAKYERRENSGIMCNGITLARHCLLSKEYAERYPEICDSRSKDYFGRYRVDDYLDELDMTIGEALLSPTRVYAPIIAKILEVLADHVRGMVHNTGGGLTKSLRLGNGLRYIKDSLPPPDPIFLIIQREGRISWREMYETFNMGIGFEVLVDEEAVDEVINIAESYGVEAYVIGKVEKGTPNLNEVIVRSERGTFVYKRRPSGST